MNHIFVKGSVLGVEPQDIENNTVTPLSRPFKQSEQDKVLGTNSMYNSITPSSIPKNTFLNPSAVDFNFITHFEKGKNKEKPVFNKTSDIKDVIREINQDEDFNVKLIR